MGTAQIQAGWKPAPHATAHPFGLVLVAGMAIGTAFTLFFVPAIYVLIARDHRAEARKGAEEKVPGGSPIAPPATAQ